MKICFSSSGFFLALGLLAGWVRSGGTWGSQAFPGSLGPSLLFCCVSFLPVSSSIVTGASLQTSNSFIVTWLSVILNSYQEKKSSLAEAEFSLLCIQIGHLGWSRVISRILPKAVRHSYRLQYFDIFLQTSLKIQPGEACGMCPPKWEEVVWLAALQWLNKDDEHNFSAMGRGILTACSHSHIVGPLLATLHF